MRSWLGLRFSWLCILELVEILIAHIGHGKPQTLTKIRGLASQIGVKIASTLLPPSSVAQAACGLHSGKDAPSEKAHANRQGHRNKAVDQ